MRSLLLAGALLLWGAPATDAGTDHVTGNSIHHRDGSVTLVPALHVQRAVTRKPTKCVRRRGMVIRCSRPGHTCKRVKVKTRTRRGTTTRRVWRCQKKAKKASRAPSSASETAPPTSAETHVPSATQMACDPSRATDFSLTDSPPAVWRQPLRWHYNPISEPTVARSQDARRLFTSVLAGWTHRIACGVDPHRTALQGVPSVLPTSFAGDIFDAEPRVGAIVVRYVDNILSGCQSPSALACTRMRFAADGSMISAEVVLLSDAGMRARDMSWSAGDSPAEHEVDFQATLMHEAGHALGLHHASPDGGQVMAPAIHAGWNGIAARRPGAGDLAGRDVLYP